MAKTSPRGVVLAAIAAAIAAALPDTGSAQAAGSPQSSAQAPSSSSGATPRSSAQQATAPTSTDRDVRASKLIGSDVRNPQGENLGKIEDLVLDVGSQRVRYAVLSFGGALGFGDKLFAYPINAFRGAPDADTLILNVDKERLRKAPGFDAGRWPDWSQRGYRSEVDRYFGTSGTPKAPSGQRLVRASELIGKDVDDASGRDAGEVEDVVINIGQGRVHFVVLDFDKAWSPDDKLLPMGMNALKMPADWTNDLVLNVPREQLDMSRGFDETGWPDFNAGGWRRDMDTYLKNLHGAEKSAAR